MEAATGGVLKPLSAQGTVVENVNVYDLTEPTTRDRYFIGKAPLGERSRSTRLRAAHRRGGSLGTGLADVRVDDGFFTTIADVDSPPEDSLAIELNGNPHVSLENLSDTVQVLNVGPFTRQSTAYGRVHAPEGLVVKTVDCAVSDDDFGHEPRQARGRSSTPGTAAITA